MRNKRDYNRKSYFAVHVEVLELFRRRAISAYDVIIYAYLSSLHMNGRFNGVQVTQKRIARICGVAEKTVSASIERLYNIGLIQNVFQIIKPHCKKKFDTTVYSLKPLENSGFILIPRFVFNFNLEPIEFTIFVELCRQRSHEFGKSWNSYNDICLNLGFNPEHAKSKVIKVIKALVACGLIAKKTRVIRKVGNVDNIYRINFYEEAVIVKERRRFVTAETPSKKFSRYKRDKSNPLMIIPRFNENVKPPPKIFNVQLYFEEVEPAFFSGF